MTAHEWCLNPFVSQVGFFLRERRPHPGIPDGVSQSLRKSGRFFLINGERKNQRVREASLNPFVSQVGFFVRTKEGALRLGEHRLNPFVSQVGFFWQAPERGLPRGHLRLNPFVSQVGFFRKFYRDNKGRFITGLNPFVSQVGFFPGKAAVLTELLMEWSQSLRKSGRFFRGRQ